MVTPASLPRILGPITCLALLCSSLPSFAQEAKKTDSSKEQSEEAVFIPVEYRPPPYQISVGVRISGKAKVKFSGIGNIPYNNADPRDNITDKTLTRYYDNGGVAPDHSLNIDGTTKVMTDGATNQWTFSSSSQLQPSTFPNATTVSMEANKVESSGATASAETGASTAWDIEISRQLGGNKRFSWGVIFGAGISDINAKTAGTVKANRRTITDIYAIDGTDQRLTSLATDNTTRVYKPGGYVSPGPVLWAQRLKADNTLEFDSDGKPVLVETSGPVTYPAGLNPVFEWRDNSLRLTQTPTRSDVVTEGVDVTGTWQVKGAFMTARFGPYVAMQLGRHFAARASAGITLTVLGAQFKFEEKYLVPSLNKYISTDSDHLRSNEDPNKLYRNESTVTGTFGYFASGEVDWFLTNRTGLFLGAMYEGYARDLRITMPNTTQVANIETSTGTVIRTGLTTRF